MTGRAFEAVLTTRDGPIWYSVGRDELDDFTRESRQDPAVIDILVFDGDTVIYDTYGNHRVPVDWSGIDAQPQRKQQ